MTRTKLHVLYGRLDRISKEMQEDNERFWKWRKDNGVTGRYDFDAWPGAAHSKDIRARYDTVGKRILEHGEKDFESVVRDAVLDRVDDDAFAKRLYQSLTNVTWEHDDGSRYATSFRAAGGFIAELRDVGEDYMGFYCCAPEGRPQDEIVEALAPYGWHPMEGRR